MTVENEKANSRGVHSPITLCPWLVALGALALYGLTLNHWVTFNSLPYAAQLTGWDWHPGPLLWRPNSQYPLFYLLTLPLKLLPMTWRPVGLNVFTAVCAALTLAVLARSIRLLSHDRTKEQRLREGSPHALLSVRMAFLPALLAVVMLAGELSFWENATAGSVEMLDLLVFGFLILCLLEYRVSKNGWRLDLFAVVYGMGVANNWALIGFFPCFLVALVWLKRLAFFNWRFVLRMVGWGALGLSLYLLLPFLGTVAGDGGFWDLLHLKLGEQHFFLTRFPRYVALLAAVPSLVPLFFAAINWPSFEGELSAGAHDITRLLFRLLHIIFLAVCLLMFFDVKLSPSPRFRFGIGVEGPPAFLTFYYLAALSVGYYAGYVLLVFGKDVTFRWGRATGLLKVINGAVVVLLWVTALALPVLLYKENLAHISDTNHAPVAQFGMEMAKSLPTKPAVVLADDIVRLGLTMGGAEKLGLPAQYTFIESPSLIHREYLQYLFKRYPTFTNEIKNPSQLPEELGSAQIGDLLAHICRHQAVYYAHPSFGSYFELVCMTPRGLGGDVHPYPSNALEKIVLTKEQVTANQAFFRALKEDTLNSLPELAKRNSEAARVANCYSQVLDYWGAQLQMYATELHLEHEFLADAGAQFAEAVALNPDNGVAKINQQFNEHLRGLPPTPPVISSSDVANHVTTWDAVYNNCGPVDVPDLYIEAGRDFAQHLDFLQAAHMFQRCLELAPTNPAAELDLAKTYIDLGLVKGGLERIKAIRDNFTGSPLELLRVEALGNFKLKDYDKTDKLLTEARREFPNNEEFAGVTAEFYRQMGYTILMEANGDPKTQEQSAKWFNKSLEALQDQLQILNRPMTVSASSGKIASVTLRVADAQMLLKQYEPAIATLTLLVRQYDKDPVPRLNLAISELEFNKLDAAKKDYLAVEALKPPPSYMVPAYFGLAQIAHEEKDAASEAHYCELYLKSAATNTVEFANVTQEYRKVQGR